MNIENYFEEQKGITVDAARNAGAKYTAIDICKFAKNYHESEVKNLDISLVSKELFLVILDKYQVECQMKYNTGTVPDAR